MNQHRRETPLNSTGLDLPASIAYPAENPLSKRIQRLLDGGEHQERFLARCLDCPGRAILLSYGDINGLNIEQLISGFV